MKTKEEYDAAMEQLHGALVKNWTVDFNDFPKWLAAVRAHVEALESADHRYRSVIHEQEKRIAELHRARNSAEEYAESAPIIRIDYDESGEPGNIAAGWKCEAGRAYREVHAVPVEPNVSTASTGPSDVSKNGPNVDNTPARTPSVQGLREQLEAATKLNESTYCAYCGQRFELSGQDAVEAVGKHIHECWRRMNGRIEQIAEKAWEEQLNEWPAARVLPSYVAQKFAERVARAVLEDIRRLKRTRATQTRIEGLAVRDFVEEIEALFAEQQESKDPELSNG